MSHIEKPYLTKRMEYTIQVQYSMMEVPGKLVILAVKYIST
jgi:hypothetical protein